MLMSKLDNWLTSFDNQSIKRRVFILSMFVVVCFALLSPLGVAPDYYPYLKFFDWSAKASWTQLFNNPKSWEPGFTFLVFTLARWADSSAIVFAILVLLSSGFKLAFLYRLSTPLAYMLCVVLFFFKVFPLLDDNQLRGALAISFLFLAYYEWTCKRQLVSTLIYAFFALTFHYLSIALFALIFVIGMRTQITRSLVVGIGLLLLVFLTMSAIFIVPIAAELIPRLGGYLRGDLGPAVSFVLSPVFYPEFFLIVSSFFFWNDCTENMKRIVLLQVLGFSIFYGFFDYGVIGTRVREAISVFWLFYVVDYSKMSLSLRTSTVTFVGMNVLLGSYLFYFSDFFEPTHG